MKTLIDPNRLERIKLYTKLANCLDGNLAEVGVYKGGSAEVIASNKSPEKKLFLFDTFEGMPETDFRDNVHKRKDFNNTSYQEICQHFHKHQNVFVHKGAFPHKNYNFVQDEIFSLVHLDVDIYKSYRDCLNFFYPRMVHGGFIIMDDYNAPSCLGAKLAINEFMKNKKEYLIWPQASQIIFIKNGNPTFSTFFPKCLS